MIKKFQLRMVLVLMILLCGILCSILIVTNWSNYRVNLRQQRLEARETIHQIGSMEFLTEEQSDERLKSLEYASVLIPDEEGQNLKIGAYFLTDYTREEILQYAQKVVADGMHDGNKNDLVYIVKKRHSKSDNRYIIFLKSDHGMEGVKSMTIYSVIIAAVGCVVILFVSIGLSRWMITPTLRSLTAEKEFVSNVSHELKTPLTIIRANAEFLTQKYGEQKELNYICTESEKMNRMIGQMLDLMRLDSSVRQREYQRFDLTNALLSVALPFESVAYERKLNMELDIADGMSLFGDEEQIQRVLSILMDNALNYTPTGGRILVQAQQGMKKTILCVSNDGDEIPPNMRERIFERFQRADDTRDAQGNHYGLGLPIAEKIVEKHSGRIIVDYQDGMNVFFVILRGKSVK